MVSRTVCVHQVFMGVYRGHLAFLVGELAGPRQAVVEGRRDEARGGLFFGVTPRCRRLERPRAKLPHHYDGFTGCPCTLVPIRGKHLLGWRRRHNRDHAKIRRLGERAMAIFKSWRALRKLVTPPGSQPLFEPSSPSNSPADQDGTDSHPPGPRPTAHGICADASLEE